MSAISRWWHKRKWRAAQQDYFYCLWRLSLLSKDADSYEEAMADKHMAMSACEYHWIRAGRPDE